MDTPLAALLELEMLHSIRDVYVVAVDTGVSESTVQETARRSQEGAFRKVFFIAGLLANHDDVGRRRPFAQTRPASHGGRGHIPCTIGRLCLAEPTCIWRVCRVLLLCSSRPACYFPKSRRSSVLASVSTRLRSAARFFPARLI